MGISGQKPKKRSVAFADGGRTAAASGAPPPAVAIKGKVAKSSKRPEKKEATKRKTAAPKKKTPSSDGPKPTARKPVDADDLSDVDSAAEPSASHSKKAVEFRFLPAEFQEPELLRYCGQFGSAVAGCVCLRHKKTNSSRGIGIVSFKDESAIPLVIEESNGMLLGGRTVRCKVVYLKRSLPPLRRSLSRRAKDVQRRTRGPQLRRFVNTKVLGTSPSYANPVPVPPRTEAIVGALLKYSRKEKSHNQLLKRMGIQYEFHGFQSQMKAVPRELIKSKSEMREIRATQKAARAVQTAERKAAKRAAPRRSKRAVAAA